MKTQQVEEEKLQVGDLVVCDGLNTGKVGRFLGTGSSPHSIKLLIDGYERYEPDYCLLEVTEQNKKAVELLVLHLRQAPQARREEVADLYRI